MKKSGESWWGGGGIDTRPAEGKISGREVNGLVQKRFISIVFVHGALNAVLKL
jgi:hypothetical protein